MGEVTYCATTSERRDVLMEGEMSRGEMVMKMEEWFKGIDEFGNDDDKRVYKEIVALIKKPKVTEEWIDEKAMEIAHAFSDIHVIAMEQARSFIRSLVDERQHM